MQLKGKQTNKNKPGLAFIAGPMHAMKAARGRKKDQKKRNKLPSENGRFFQRMKMTGGGPSGGSHLDLFSWTFFGSTVWGLSPEDIFERAIFDGLWFGSTYGTVPYGTAQNFVLGWMAPPFVRTGMGEKTDAVLACLCLRSSSRERNPLLSDFWDLCSAFVQALNLHLDCCYRVSASSPV